LPASKRAVIALDTTRLDKLLDIDEKSLTATFQAGIDGPSLEAELGDRGFTLGHFPQSFEHSTLGGWIAARSSGQLSDGYGGIDALLVSAKVVTPRGELQTLTVPRHAVGPDLKQVVLGSEGTLGVIVEATLRIREKMAVQDVRGMLFRDFSSGVRTIRAWARAGLPMMMMRLSDAQETDLSLMLRHDPDKRFDAGATLLDATKSVGYGENRALMLFGIEGDERARLSAQMLRAQAIGVLNGGLPLGKGPGASWKKERFRTPYLRDFMLDHGVAIDTMETAFEWSKLEEGHSHVLEAMRAATKRHAGGGLAMGHVSHSYPDGACVYFVVIYPVRAVDALNQWREIKRAITDAIVDAGGTVSHHHGVGTDHAPWLPREKGPLGVAAIQALRNTFDPEGMMNPGKLV
jgi:alkyldihydroxyacetonephosphate synthase